MRFKRSHRESLSPLAPYQFGGIKRREGKKKYNTTKAGNGFVYIYLDKAHYPGKEKQLLPSAFPLVFPPVPQNYNVQIHKRICCFCTLEINTTVGRECRCSAGAAPKQTPPSPPPSIKEWVRSQTIVCPSVWLYSTAHSQNHATDC